MALPAAIRVVSAVFQPHGTDEFKPLLCFVDPSLESNREMFRIEARYAENLIDNIRIAAAEATAKADQIRDCDPEKRELLVATTGGNA